MTEERRLEMFPAVLRAAERVSVVVRSAAGIDRRGLHVTNLEALSGALERLDPRRGGHLPRRRLLAAALRGRRTAPWSRATRTSAAIAAASVIAKVTRDRYMHRAAAEHPGWGFEEHVGYSTPEHRAAIDQIGISPLHRRSFQSVAYTQLELDRRIRRSIGQAEHLPPGLLISELMHQKRADVLDVDDRPGGRR